MQKLSLQKRSFFNSIGLDTNNLPSELQIKSNSIQTKIPRESLVYLNHRDLTIPKTKLFRLKSLFGTDSSKLDNKTWIDIFIENEKTDNIIAQYFKNPNYYFQDLKKANQTEVKDSIELYEDNGKFFIKDGTARLSLMMIKYLLEMSRAQSKEEKLLINKQYAYAAVVRSTPKDRDLIFMINSLYDVFGTRLKIKKIDDDNEYSYLLKIDDEKMEFSNKEEFENLLKQNYLPKEFKSFDDLKKKLREIAEIGFQYKENDDNEELVDRFLIMGKLFPNYEVYTKYYKKIINYNLEDDFVLKLDINSVSYDDILKKLIKIVKQEEINMSKVEKDESSKSKTKTKTTKKVSESKTTVKKVKEEKSSAKSPAVSKAKNKVVAKAEEVEKPKKVKETDNEEKIKKAKECAASSITSIINNIEMTYFKLKTEESKSLDLANSTGIELNIDKINDISINGIINSIKENSFAVKKKIEDLTKLEDINFNNDYLNDLKQLSNDKSIINEYGEEMKSIYTTCFNKNARKLITDAKLKKLDRQRKEVESEKCSFFSKLIGKAKLKQAKLDNLNLKEQLILTESQFSSNSYITLEDGLSDIYAYIKTEEDVNCLSDVKVYLKNVESNNQIKSMIDQEKLSKKTKEKIDQQRNLPQLVLSKEKKHLFSKAQINLVQEKNNELKRVIQINRANSLKMQNTGMIPILGNIKSTRAVKKFIGNLTQIDTTLKNQKD